MAEKLLVAVDPAKFVIGHSDYAGMTPAAARKAIRALIDKYNVAITPEKVTKDRAEKQVLNEGLPDRVPGQAIMEGITWVRCYYDGTTNTAQIDNGKAVVIDTVKGGMVTGIHPSWAPDEYKIVGIALDRYTSTAAEGGLIPVRLTPPGASDAKEIRLCITGPTSLGSPYPDYTEARRIFPIFFLPNPSFAISNPETPSGENPSLITGGSGFATEWAYNVGLGYVPVSTTLIAWTVNGQWYIEYYSPPFILKELYEDLLPNSSARWYATGGSFGGGTPSVQKVYSINAKPGYKWPAGSQFMGAYNHPRYYAMKFFTCPVPQ